MDSFGVIVVYLLPVLLVVLAYFTGSYIEHRHFASIRRREQRLVDLPVVNFDDADGQFPTNRDFRYASFVTGSVVISVVCFFEHAVMVTRNTAMSAKTKNSLRNIRQTSLRQLNCSRQPATFLNELTSPGYHLATIFAYPPYGCQ